MTVSIRSRFGAFELKVLKEGGEWEMLSVHATIEEARIAANIYFLTHLRYAGPSAQEDQT